MGFPEWTLWGMGLSVVGALIAITLSWLGQSPKLLRRIGLTSLRLDLRVRAFTGYALALLLLATAFFLAGVPLGGSTADNGTVAQEASEATSEDAALTATPDSALAEVSPAPDSLSPTPATPETGAFSGPPTTEAESEPTLDEGGITSEPIRATSPVTATATVPAASVPADSTVAPTETSTPLPTATPQPTETPLPTLTPTAIVGPTAIVNSDGSTLWLRRSPGGQNTVLVQDGDLVLLLSGRANQGGMLWREVATVAGVEGWLRQEFLVISDS